MDDGVPAIPTAAVAAAMTRRSGTTSRTTARALTLPLRARVVIMMSFKYCTELLYCRTTWKEMAGVSGVEDGGAEKLLGNSLVSWLHATLRKVRFFRLPIDSGSSVETRCSFCQYCVLAP